MLELFPEQNDSWTAALLLGNGFVSLLFGVQKPLAIGAAASSGGIQTGLQMAGQRPALVLGAEFAQALLSQSAFH